MGEHETILPAPPPARIALWAAANARWFRFTGALARLLRRIARSGLRALAPHERRSLPALAGEGHSLEVQRMALAQEWGRSRWMETPHTPRPSPAARASASERATAVEIRRMS